MRRGSLCFASHAPSLFALTCLLQVCVMNDFSSGSDGYVSLKGLGYGRGRCFQGLWRISLGRIPFAVGSIPLTALIRWEDFCTFFSRCVSFCKKGF